MTCDNKRVRELPKTYKKPRRTAPAELQPTVSYDSLAKAMSKYRRPCPLYTNLTDRLGDFTRHDMRSRPEPPTHVQNATNNISQHVAQGHERGSLEVRIRVGAVCVLRRRKRQIVDDPSFRRGYDHGQRRQPQAGDGVRFAARENDCPPKLYVVKNLREYSVKTGGLHRYGLSMPRPRRCLCPPPRERARRVRQYPPTSLGTRSVVQTKNES